MSKAHGLRVFVILVKQLLSETADQIVEAVEKMISGYEEEMFQSKRKISRRRKLLDVLLQPGFRSNGISEEAQLNLSVWDKDLLIEQQQEWNSCENAVKYLMSAAADRIVEAVKKTISGYKGEMDQSKGEIIRQCKMLNALLQPEILLTRIHEKEIISAEQMPIEADDEVSSLGFSEHENEDDNDWNGIQDGDSDGSEDCTLTGDTPQSKKNTKSWICKVCGKLFHYEGSLLRHLKSHPKDDCGRCGMHFKTEEEFERHLDKHKNDVKKKHCALTVKTPKTNKNIKSCICKVCGKSFGSEGPSFLKHLKSHPKDHCGLCGMQFTTEGDFELHLITHKNEIATRKKARVVCDVCGKFFAAVWLLHLHMRSHSDEKPFTCEVCGKSFKSYQSLTHHLRSHTVGKIFRCELCGKSFSFRQALTRHHLIHTGEKPYACTVCSEHFISYSTLRKHMRTHKRKNITVTDTTPVYNEGDVDVMVITKEQLVQIICKVCGKDFHSKVSLVKHLESHPKDICGLCGIHFNTEEEFEFHLKTHKNDISKACDVCGKCFAKPSYLETHMRSHTGEMRFKCNVCDKPFRQRCQLIDHSRIHTGEKPFSCTACSKCFKTKSNLRQHRLRCRII